MSDIKYPEITVKLVGEDGNAFMIIGRVQRALRHAGLTEGRIREFQKEATSGNYDNVLRTCMRWVQII